MKEKDRKNRTRNRKIKVRERGEREEHLTKIMREKRKKGYKDIEEKFKEQS